MSLFAIYSLCFNCFNTHRLRMKLVSSYRVLPFVWPVLITACHLSGQNYLPTAFHLPRANYLNYLNKAAAIKLSISSRGFKNVNYNYQ